MASYKVIQDIEAEDKFLGPLTLKQFVFAAIGAVFGYLCFIIATKGAWFLAIPLVPVSLFGFFMAIPWSKDQPTDVWFLAKIRFKIKPKKRIWDQTGLQELVTITAPKKEEKILIKDLDETQVKSRLKALADTMNTRGWVIKHVSLPASFGRVDPNADRLLPTPIPIGSNPVIDDGIPDVLDDQDIDGLIEKKEQTHKIQLREQINRARQGVSAGSTSQKIVPNEDEDATLAKKLQEKKQTKDLYQSNMKNLRPGGEKPKTEIPASTSQKIGQQLKKTDEKKAQASVTGDISPDIISLAHNNDLNVATLARQAKKDKDDSQEVVISLH